MAGPSKSRVIAVVGVMALLLSPAWLAMSSFLFGLLAMGDPNAVEWYSLAELAWLYPTNEVVQKYGLISAAVCGAVLYLPLLILIIPKKESLHGDARWATGQEIRRAGLRGTDGIIVGEEGGKFLIASLNENPHIVLAAPSGSGKGVGFVVPNLLNYDGSFVVLDMKKENFELTAGFRAAHGHEVFLFDPASPTRRTHRWNALHYVRDDPAFRVDDLQKIASILFPDPDSGDPIWAASARSLFLGLGLYLFETPGKLRTLGQMAREAYGGDPERFRKFFDDAKRAGTPYSDTCVRMLEDFMRTPDKTRGSILKTFTSAFEIYFNPFVDAATSGNDFDFADLRRKRMTIYLGISPDNLGRLAPLLNLFFQQLVDVNVRTRPDEDPSIKYHVALLLDEFRSLGKLKVIVDAIAFLRGYWLHLLPVFQSWSQVNEVYGEQAARTFQENHRIEVTYTPGSLATAKELSERLGNKTVKSVSRSRPSGFSSGSRSMNISEAARALRMPQELLEMPDDEVIVLVRGMKPIKGEKIRYYKDPRFTGRIVPPPPVPEVQPVQVESIVPQAPAVTTRPVDVSDIDSLYTRDLSDFDLDFSGITVPTGDLSQEDAEALADAMFAQLTTKRA